MKGENTPPPSLTNAACRPKGASLHLFSFSSFTGEEKGVSTNVLYLCSHKNKTIAMILNTLSYTYRVAQLEELSAQEQELVHTACTATDRSYAPYSQFHVGAAVLLSDGTIVEGSNQENAAYPSGTCAERCALFYANSHYPDQPVAAIAVAARLHSGEFLTTPITPCGSCRQVLLETEKRYGQPVRVFLYGTTGIYIIDRCSDLLPFHFTSDALHNQ